jgi:glutathione S-transferase
MLLIGPNRSPYTRRVAITLNIYGIPYEQRPLSGFDDRAEVRAFNPLGRIPALVLDDGDTLVDSGAILDHLDELHGRERALIAPSGPERRAVLRACAVLMGVCDKVLQAAYHRNHVPAEKRHRPWIDDCTAQARAALTSVEATIAPDASHLLLDHLTHADVAAVVAERFARGGLGIDTVKEMPRLAALTNKLNARPDFQVIEHPRTAFS